MAKYSKELLAPLVRDSVSVREVCIKLGLSKDSGAANYIAKVINKLGIDRSHFLGRGANRGKNHKGGIKRAWQSVLVCRDDFVKEKAHALTKALLEYGRTYSCEGVGCTLTSIWLNQPLKLQVHHKNGNWQDNRPDNLSFLCPNCHSQTENFAGRKSKRGDGGTADAQDSESCIRKGVGVQISLSALQ